VLLDLTAGGGAAVGLDAGSELLQVELALDRAHEALLALVVLGITDDLAGVGNPIGEDMDVLVLGVGVAGHQILVVEELHADQVATADVCPLGVGEFLAGGGGKGDVQYSPFQIRPQLADGTEFGG